MLAYCRIFRQIASIAFEKNTCWRVLTMHSRASIIRDMNKLSLERRARILSCLCEGSSARATTRMQGCSRDAVLKFIEDAGTACAAYHDQHVRGIASKRVQCDEIWSFCYAKAKNALAGCGKRIVSHW